MMIEAGQVKKEILEQYRDTELGPVLDMLCDIIDSAFRAGYALACSNNFDMKKLGWKEITVNEAIEIADAQITTIEDAIDTDNEQLKAFYDGYKTLYLSDDSKGIEVTLKLPMLPGEVGKHNQEHGEGTHGS